MNQIVIPKNLKLPTAFDAFRSRARELNAAATAGISAGGFPVLSIRGKVFRIKKGGEETVVSERDERTGRERAMRELSVVILRVSGAVSKNWYEHGYSDGSDAAPDCFSADGIRPDPASPKLQSPKGCAACPHNQFGTNATGRGKACADSKRLVVVPAGDIENKHFGGPMLLRLPPMSMKNFKPYIDMLAANDVPYNAVRTRLVIDDAPEFPSVMFEFDGVIEDESEARRVLELFDDEQTKRIVNEVSEMKDAVAEAASAPLPPHDPETGEIQQAAPPPAPAPRPAPAPAPAARTARPAPAPAPKTAPAPKPAPAPVAAPVEELLDDVMAAPLADAEPQADEGAGVPDSLDDMLADLLSEDK